MKIRKHAQAKLKQPRAILRIAAVAAVAGPAMPGHSIHHAAQRSALVITELTEPAPGTCRVQLSMRCCCGWLKSPCTRGMAGQAPAELKRAWSTAFC